MWADRHAAARLISPELKRKPLNLQETGFMVFTGVIVLEGNLRNASFCFRAVISLQNLIRST